MNWRVFLFLLFRLLLPLPLHPLPPTPHTSLSRFFHLSFSFGFSSSCRFSFLFSFRMQIAYGRSANGCLGVTRLPRNFTTVLISCRAEVLSETKPRVASNRQRNAVFLSLYFSRARTRGLCIDQRCMQTILSRPGSNDFRLSDNFGRTAERPPRSTTY